jgi:hypothetical protein
VLDIGSREAAQDRLGISGALGQRGRVAHHLDVLLLDQLPIDRPGEDAAEIGIELQLALVGVAGGQSKILGW